MSENLKSYMTEQEQRQIDIILKRAQKRMREKQAVSYEHQFLFLSCQYDCYEEMAQRNQEHQIDSPDDFLKLMRQVCDFCKRHRACSREGGIEEGIDEDLPF